MAEARPPGATFDAVPTLQRDLVFDIGMHRGEDSAVYLRKGFRVVGVEAVPALAAESSATLAAHVGSGRLTVVNAAIAERPGPIRFYLDDNSVWGTTSVEWRRRNSRLGSASPGTLDIEGITCGQLFAAHGIPYYMKIDIEGADRLCLEALAEQEARCPFVSVESDKATWAGLKAEIDLLCRLGYRRFKVVPQHKVHRQRTPHPAREGDDVEVSFVTGQSGLFGEEAPGRWLGRRSALARYRIIFVRYRVLGDDGLLSHGPLRTVKAALYRLGVGPGWYDTHAGR